MTKIVSVSPITEEELLDLGLGQDKPEPESDYEWSNYLPNKSGAESDYEWSDYLRSFSSGIDNTARSLGTPLLRALGADEAAQGWNDYWQERADWRSAQQSPDWTRDTKEPFFVKGADGEKHFNPNALNLGKIADLGIQSIPGTTLGMAPGIGTAKYVNALTKAGKITPWFGRLLTGAGASAGEVAVSVPSSMQNVYDEVMNLPEETLMQSQDYLDLLADTGDVNEARKRLAWDVSKSTALESGATTGVLSAPFGWGMGKILSEGGPLLARAIKGGVTEGVQETLQSGGEQYWVNRAVQRADPNLGSWENVPEAMVGGGLSGMAMGAGMSAAFGERPGSEPSGGRNDAAKDKTKNGYRNLFEDENPGAADWYSEEAVNRRFAERMPKKDFDPTVDAFLGNYPQVLGFSEGASSQQAGEQETPPAFSPLDDLGNVKMFSPQDLAGMDREQVRAVAKARGLDVKNNAGKHVPRPKLISGILKAQDDELYYSENAVNQRFLDHFSPMAPTLSDQFLDQSVTLGMPQQAGETRTEQTLKAVRELERREAEATLAEAEVELAKAATIQAPTVASLGSPDTSEYPVGPQQIAGPEPEEGQTLGVRGPSKNLEATSVRPFDGEPVKPAMPDDIQDSATVLPGEARAVDVVEDGSQAKGNEVEGVWAWNNMPEEDRREVAIRLFGAELSESPWIGKGSKFSHVPFDKKAKLERFLSEPGNVSVGPDGAPRYVRSGENAKPQRDPAKPMYAKGKRVVLEDGRHGEIVDSRTITWKTSIFVPGEGASAPRETTHHHSYDVKTDHGSTVNVEESSISEETERPGEPDYLDIKLQGGKLVTPQQLVKDIKYKDSNHARLLSRADNARSIDKKRALRRDAERSKSEADTLRDALRRWADQYPAAAKRLGVAPEDGGEQSPQAGPEAVDGIVKFNGGRIVEDAGIGFVRVHFDQKPDAKTRDDLKRAGFRWQSGILAWARKFSAQAVNDARSIVGASPPASTTENPAPTNKTRGGTGQDVSADAPIPDAETTDALDDADRELGESATGPEQSDGPTDEELILAAMKGFDDEIARQKTASDTVQKPAGQSGDVQTKPRRTAQNAANSAVDHAKDFAKGLAELAELFSGLDVGLSIQDVSKPREDVYQRALPIFMRTWDAAKGMAKDTTEAFTLFGRDVARAIGEAGKAYLNKFLTEVALPEVRGVSSKKTEEEPHHDTRGDGPGDIGALAGLPQEGAEETRSAGEGQGATGRVREADAERDGHAEEDRPVGRGGLGGSQKPVLHRPASGTRTGGLADSPLRPDGRLETLAGENPGNFVITDEVGLGEGTDGEKIERNLQALRTLRKVQKEGRYPTREEQAEMARYVGWGGLKNVFASGKAEANDMYGRAQRELRELLSPEEYTAASYSIANAHYTAKGVVDAMWRALRHFGFTGGRALEPTVGTGNFLGLQPADMAAATEWHASELDAVTGQIARQLYPESNILAATGFQDAPFIDGAFDIAIGNPPFGSETIRDKSKRRAHLSGMKIHNYIIAKAGMHLRPGGVMSMVVTHRFLDTANPEARAVLAKDFKFLGAIRLPETAFKANAGTEVVTDIVFLQKLREGEAPDLEASWLDTGGTITVDGQAIRVNRYYQEHPENILGRSAMDGRMNVMFVGGEKKAYTVHADGRDLGAAIDDVLKNGSFGEHAGILRKSPADMDLGAAMLTQSDIPVGGVMLDADGRVWKRDFDDENGNAVVEELTPESLIKDDAWNWKNAYDAIETLRKDATAGHVQEGTVADVLDAVRFAYKADGGEKKSPTKAEKALYSIADAVRRKGGRTPWTFESQLREIKKALEGRQLGTDGFRRVKGLLDLRNRTLALIRAEMADAPDMESLRKELARAYNRFVKVFGFVSDPRNDMLLGGDVGAESGLEASYSKAVSKSEAGKGGGKPKPASAVKADILSKRVHFPRKEITSAKGANDAYQISLTERGRLDLPHIAKLLGKDVQSAIQELSAGDHPLIFKNPETGEYEGADEYLSGNVKHKLAVAEKKGLDANAKALREVLPEPKTKEQIRPGIRSFWIPADIYEGFLQALGVRNPVVSVRRSDGRIVARGTEGSPSEFGLRFKHDDAGLLDIFNAATRGKGIVVTRKTSDGKSTYTDISATKEVSTRIEQMGKAFMDWAFSDEDRAKTIVDAFNESMNTHVPRAFNGEKYFRPVGMSPSIRLRATQKNAAWRIVQSATTLLDHVVGAGKTFTVIAGVMERKRLGLSRKPMIVVPNHLVTQWAKDFYRLYPGCRILAATPKDFEAKRRRRLFARIATGDFDAIIVGHSSFGFIEAPGNDVRGIIQEKIEDLQKAMDEAKASGESKRTLSQMKKRLQGYEAKLRSIAERSVDKMGIDLSAMGIDFLAVDEAHEFKNLEYATASERVVGMNDPNGSKKAFDLYTKIRGLLSRDGAVAFATGTPVSNSLVEIYTMLSYLASDELALRGQRHFDAWSGDYAVTETRDEQTATQKLKPRRTLSALTNLSSLRQLYEQFADIITMGDLKRLYSREMEERNKKDGTNFSTEFPVPRVKSGGRMLDTGDITPQQQEYMDYLVARMYGIEKSKGDRDYPRIDNPLWVLSDARQMSLDIRVVDPTAKRDENGKVVRSARRIKEIYDRWDKERGTQMVFCDLSTPSKSASKEAKKLLSDYAGLVLGKERGKAFLADSETSNVEKLEALAERAEEAMLELDGEDAARDALEKFLDGVEEHKVVMRTADLGFSVYDDLKALLVESGIPEREIAFIHDFNTSEQKERLFSRMNEGYVRVLIGSTQKMGAGTNAQERMVALHHLDAPWRPSDIEQREGRIIRQGNRFYEADPDGFEVEIVAYSTSGTSDVVMWQILERKARAIEQFREGGLDYVEEESSDSDQYAEFMATSTGNRVFKDQLDADREFQRLEAEVGSLLIARQDALDFLARADEVERKNKERVDALSALKVGDLEYKGETASLAEHTRVMAKAQARHDAEYAKYVEERKKAEELVAQWETQPAESRGKKPAMPERPSEPNFKSKDVLEHSAYARMVGRMISDIDAHPDRPVTCKLGNVEIVLSSRLGSDKVTRDWSVSVQTGAEAIPLGDSTAQTAAASRKLFSAFDPGDVAHVISWGLGEAERRLAFTKGLRAKSERLAKEDVDDKAFKTAKAVADWFNHQVRFAEIEADIARAERGSRYIAEERRRRVSLSAAQRAERETVEFDGERYETTGIAVRPGALDGSPGLAQATRLSDGLPVVLETKRREGQEGGVEYVGVVEQPESLRGSKEAPTPDSGVRFLVREDGQERSGNGLRVPVVKETIAPHLAREDWPKGVTVSVVREESSLPPPVLAEIKRMGYGGRVQGVYFNGEVYLVAENLDSRAEVETALLHEGVKHHGMRMLLGASYGLTMQMAWKNDAVRAKAKGLLAEQGLENWREASQEQRDAAVEEAIVAMSDAGERAGFIDRIISAIRRALRRMGFDLELSDAEIRDLMSQAINRARGRRGGSERKTVPVVIADGETPSVEDMSSLLKELQGTSERNDDTGWEISFGKIGLSKTLGHMANPLSRLGTTKTRELVQKSVYFATEENRHEKSLVHAPWVHHFYAPMAIGGRQALARLVIRETDDGQKYYDSILSKIEEPAKSLGHTGYQYQGRHQGTGSAEMNIATLMELVKQVRPDHAAGIERDANGEPVLPKPFGRHDIRFMRKAEAKTTKDSAEMAKSLDAITHKGYVGKRDLGLAKRLLMAPYWIAKRFPEFRKAMDREIMRTEDRTAATVADVEPIFAALKGLSREDRKDLRGLIHAADGKQLKGVKVTEKFLEVEKDLHGFPVYTLNDKHYEDIDRVLKSNGVNPAVRKAFIAISRQLDGALNKSYNRMREAKGIKPDPGMIEEYRREMGRIVNYFPHVRIGNWYVRATDPETGRVVFRKHFWASGKTQASMVYRKHVKTSPNISWEFGEVQGLPEDVYEFPIPVQAMEQVMSAAVDRTRGMDEDKREAFKKAIAESISDVLKSRGWGKHMIKRQDVPGYETEDIERVLFGYFSGLNGWLSKMDAAADYADILREVSAVDRPGLYSYTARYIRDMLQNSDTVDRYVGMAKNIMFLKFLGGNIKTAAVNALQNFQTGMWRLSMDVGVSAIPRWLKASADDMVSAAVKGKSLAQDENRLLDELFREGATTANLLQEMQGEASGSFGGKAWGKFTQAMGLPMAIAERFNRGSLALAAYRAARDGKITNAKTLKSMGLSRGDKASYEQAKAFAKEVVLDAHFLYGKANRPQPMRGSAGGKLLSSAYTFRQFTHNVLSLWRWMWSQGWAGKKALAGSLLSTMAIGGVTSLPLYHTLAALLRQMTGEDPDKELRDALPESLALRDVVTYGLPSLVGVSLGGSIGMELPILQDLETDKPLADQIMGNAVEILGVPVAVIRQLTDGMEYAAGGDYWRAVEQVAPLVVSNPMAAYRMWSEGAFTKSGRPIPIEGEDNRLKGEDAAKKALGFQPLSRTKGWDAYKRVKDIDAYRKNEQDGLVREYVRAVRAQDDAAVNAVVEEWIEWNEKAMAKDRPELVLQPLPKLAKSRMRPTKPSARMRGLDAETREDLGLMN